MNGITGKVLIIAGVVLIILGVIIMFWSRIPFFGKLPGDIIIEKQNVRIFFPIVTCLLASLFLTLIFNIILRFFR